MILYFSKFPKGFLKPVVGINVTKHFGCMARQNSATVFLNSLGEKA